MSAREIDETGKLASNMAGAWAQRADRAADVIRVARIAPALVKPEAVEQAAKDYDKAVVEMGRWLS